VSDGDTLARSRIRTAAPPGQKAAGYNPPSSKMF
jgi:hypothetical protein